MSAPVTASPLDTMGSFDERLRLLEARINACNTLVDYITARCFMNGRGMMLDALHCLTTDLRAELDEHQAEFDQFEARVQGGSE